MKSKKDDNENHDEDIEEFLKEFLKNIKESKSFNQFLEEEDEKFKKFEAIKGDVFNKVRDMIDGLDFILIVHSRTGRCITGQTTTKEESLEVMRSIILEHTSLNPE